MKIRAVLVGGGLSLFPILAFAQSAGQVQTVPAIQPDSTAASPADAYSAPIPLISQAPVNLSPKEKAGVALAKAYQNAPEMPVVGDDGAVQMNFAATMPDVVCAPLHICAIELQPGEIVNNLNIGDSVRWKVSPAVSGSGQGQVTNVIIKPTDAGLRTDLDIFTNRRVYTLSLVSTKDSYMPLVTFVYPEDVQQEWAAYHQQVSNYEQNTVLPNGLSVANLDFHYRISGNASWKPLRVYTDGAKTYIQMPPSVSVSNMPALVALGTGGLFTSAPTQIVNYRVKDHTYIVDQVLKRAELISGVGDDQQRVTITHIGAISDDEAGAGEGG